MREYDVALSFAGEDRHYAERLAELLRAEEYLVFYDEYELAKLWGKDLYVYLSSVYKDRAEYCVMFLSEYYAQKVWTNHERESAQARHLRKIGNTFFQSVLTTQRFQEFCQPLDILIYVQ